MGTVFWDAEICSLFDFLLKGKTTRVICCVQNLRKLCALHEKHLMKKDCHISMHCCSTSHYLSDGDNHREWIGSAPAPTIQSRLGPLRLSTS